MDLGAEFWQRALEHLPAAALLLLALGWQGWQGFRGIISRLDRFHSRLNDHETVLKAHGLATVDDLADGEHKLVPTHHEMRNGRA